MLHEYPVDASHRAAQAAVAVLCGDVGLQPGVALLLAHVAGFGLFALRAVGAAVEVAVLVAAAVADIVQAAGLAERAARDVVRNQILGEAGAAIGGLVFGGAGGGRHPRGEQNDGEADQEQAREGVHRGRPVRCGCRVPRVAVAAAGAWPWL